MSQKISHSGVIESILGDSIKVRIVQTSACAACKVANHCNAAESKVKVVDVFGCDTTKYTTGEAVTVWASKDVANKALLLGFGLPFLLLLGVLVAVLYLTENEGVAALTALGSLLPYYFLLWLRRDSIQRGISFHIEE
ncbi:MAG: SoxR reducing system RseC family protein [Prevotella sp.]|nr:SoxR reducing system RseC family protein [Prevotella sp.]